MSAENEQQLLDDPMKVNPMLSSWYDRANNARHQYEDKDPRLTSGNPDAKERDRQKRETIRIIKGVMEERAGIRLRREDVERQERMAENLPDDMLLRELARRGLR